MFTSFYGLRQNFKTREEKSFKKTVTANNIRDPFLHVFCYSIILSVQKLDLIHYLPCLLYKLLNLGESPNLARLVMGKDE